MMLRRGVLVLGASCAWGRVVAQTAAQPAARLPAVTVWDFDDQSPDPAAAPYLRRALAENLTGHLLRVPGLPVVERQRLRELLDEQRLSSGALADIDTRLRLGRIVGAARMVFGGYLVLGEEVQVHARVVDTASSRVLVSDSFTGGLATVMQQAEALNGRLARALGGQAPAAAGLGAASWEAYDRALALADAGQLDEAIAALQALLAREPRFVPAERQLLALLQRASRR